MRTRKTIQGCNTDKQEIGAPGQLSNSRGCADSLYETFGRYQASKFAPVAPYHIYQQFEVNDYKPANILLLAHDVVQHAQEYKDTFASSFWNDTNIIMDNSLVEMKNAVDIGMVFDAAELVAADVVVLPDVMGDGVASAQSTIKAWDEWNYKFRDYQKMIVLHGKSTQDFFAGGEMLVEAGLDPDWISIPRKIQGVDYIDRWQWIEYSKMLFPYKPIHLLGFSDELWEDITAASHPSVKSIDSAVPLRLTSLSVLSENAGPRGDWWETATFNSSMIDRCKHIDTLINRLV